MSYSHSIFPLRPVHTRCRDDRNGTTTTTTVLQYLFLRSNRDGYDIIVIHVVTICTRPYTARFRRRPPFNKNRLPATKSGTRYGTTDFHECFLQAV